MDMSEYIKTGFAGLDNKISGLRKGSLILLGARPGNVRLAFVEDIARNIASDSSRLDSVLLFTNKRQNSKIFKIIKLIIVQI